MMPGIASFLDGKRILITGGGGFLGSHIVQRLTESSSTTVFAPRRAKHDLTDAGSVRELFEATRPHIVIHAAAVVGGIGANRSNPGRFFYENAAMGIHVIEACRRF